MTDKQNGTQRTGDGMVAAGGLLVIGGALASGGTAGPFVGMTIAALGLLLVGVWLWRRYR